MQRDIAFDADGVTLRGWLVLPPKRSQPAPIVIMAPGFSSVKEHFLGDMARDLAAGGIAALVFDNRNYGASDGTPRQETDPVLQSRDWRHAISYVRALPEVDGARIGVWGIGLAGGHAIVVGAMDRRVACVVAQMPVTSGSGMAGRRARSDLVPDMIARFIADREARYAGAVPATLPFVAEDPAAPCFLPGRRAWDFIQGTLPTAPAWRNQVTLRSAEMVREYEPRAWIARVSPTPLLMIVAVQDSLTQADLALAAYKDALEPKKLVLLPGDHYDGFLRDGAAARSAARDWFAAHLL